MMIRFPQFSVLYFYQKPSQKIGRHLRLMTERFILLFWNLTKQPIKKYPNSIKQPIKKY